MDADRIEQLCEVMHDSYEAAAITHGWGTQTSSRKPWSMVPEANKATMREAVTALFDAVGYDALRAEVETLRAQMDRCRAARAESREPGLIVSDTLRARVTFRACEET